MLRPISTNISVITNFGCGADCWYCAWKGHELESVNLDTDWEKLEAFMRENAHRGKISVSGGGDSLFHYDKHRGWWHKFLSITDSINMKVDVHTREKFCDNNFWFDINRAVLSSDKLIDDLVYLDYLSDQVKVRVTHVVTKESTDGRIEEYLKFQEQYGWQFTIKQMVGHDDGGRYDLIRAKYPDIFYLDAGDYNIYYMPDNSIRTEFLKDTNA